MTLLRNIKYQKIDLTIAAANDVVSTKGVTTDRSYKKVKGIQVTCTDGEAHELGSFDKFEINSREIYCNGYEIKLIFSGIDVAPNERFDKEVDEEAENSTVDITYRDKNVAGTIFPYTVSIYLRLENPVS
ncbi:MAG: hypothetical protein ACT4ON_13525 [Bacteroidota bacterium]